MSLIIELKEAVDDLEYGYSELDSAVNELPDYRTNESSRDHMSQAESYFFNAKEVLENAIAKLEAISEKLGW
jgi:exonuclease VII small subunit